MRLPKKGAGTDTLQVKKMVDLFMDAGFTYFDTAFVYGTSEEDIKKALVERYPRESYTLATKLNAFMMAPNEKAAKQQFYKSPERTRAGYFDYYLLHAFMENNYTQYDQYHFPAQPAMQATIICSFQTARKSWCSWCARTSTKSLFYTMVLIPSRWAG